MVRCCATRSSRGTFTISPSPGRANYPTRRGEAGRAVGWRAPFDSSYWVPHTAQVALPPDTESRSPHWHIHPTRDRKSTRLNSSHGYISYAVFCLKKKKKLTHTRQTSKASSIGH